MALWLAAVAGHQQRLDGHSSHYEDFNKRSFLGHAQSEQGGGQMSDFVC